MTAEDGISEEHVLDLVQAVLPHDSNTLDPAIILATQPALIIEQVENYLREALDSQDLVFLCPPQSQQTLYPPISTTLQGNSGRYALIENHPLNKNFLRCLRYLIRMLIRVDQIQEVGSGDFHELSNFIEEALRKLEDARIGHWQQLQSALAVENNLVYDTRPFVTDTLGPAASHESIYWCSALVSALNLVYNISRPKCNLLLKTIPSLFCHHVVLQAPSVEATLEHPKDLRSALALLDIEPDIKVYIRCPNCFALYPSFPPDSCPVNCTHRAAILSDICDTPLFHSPTSDPLREPQFGFEKTKKQDKKPFKVFAYQSLRAWIGRLLCRPHMEDMMDAQWKTTRANADDGSFVYDIWGSKRLKEFKGPDGLLFSNFQDSEGRYVFSLFVDFFNPFGNKAAGKVSSSGVIFMVCHNIPEELRYRPENVYLAAVIPGPHDPSGSELNHMMNPLVDDLFDLYHSGVQLTRTWKFRNGRLVRCAVLMYVSDLGTRKAIGLASHMHTYFCVYDQLPCYDIKNLDVERWPRRTSKEVTYRANRHRWGPSIEQKKLTYIQSGIAWSPFHRLGYFDVIKSTVIDPMHNLLLGIIQNHVRNILGMTGEGISDESNIDLIFPTEEELIATIELVTDVHTTPEALKKKKKIVLQTLCRIYGESDEGNKDELVQSLLAKRELILAIYEKDNSYFDSSKVFLESTPRKSPLLAGDVLKELRQDIDRTSLPSWIRRAPRNIGEAGHGKLSADEWRTLATIHMPVTLIRLWSAPVGTLRQRKALENFMSLVNAVLLGTARSTNSKRIQYYTKYMLEYLHGLLDNTLYGEIKLKPNHHIALHLGEILDRFGPPHSYWAFHFERYIGMLRKINMNFKHDQMEVTLLKHFTMAGYLRSILLSSEPQSAELKKLRNALVANMDGKNIGSFSGALRGMYSVLDPVVRIDPKKAQRIPDELYTLLLHYLKETYPAARFCHENDEIGYRNRIIVPNAAQRVSRLEHRGVQYTTISANISDSHVVLRSRSTLQPACIIDILIHARNTESSTHTSSKVHTAFAVIKRFLPLPTGHIDPYTAHPILRARLVSAKLEENIELVPFKEIICHFASCSITDKEWVTDDSPGVMVVIALDRVWFHMKSPPSNKSDVPFIELMVQKDCLRYSHLSLTLYAFIYEHYDKSFGRIRDQYVVYN